MTSLLGSIYLFIFLTETPTRIISILNKIGLIKVNKSDLTEEANYVLTKITNSKNIKTLTKNNNRFLVLGSSELISWLPRTGLTGREFDPYHLDFFFSDYQLDMYPILWGEAGCQCFIQLLYLNNIREIPIKKVVIIISPQWFASYGISNQFFNAHLNNYNLFYDFYFNNSFPDEINSYVRNRMNQLTDYSTFTKDPILYIGVKSICSDKKYFIPLRYITVPLLWVKYQLNNFFGKIKSRIFLVKNIYQQLTVSRSVTKTKIGERIYEFETAIWDSLKLDAIERSKKFSTNNQFGIYNSYYDEILTDIKPLKTPQEYIPSESPEWRDLNVLIKYLKSRGIQPLALVPAIHKQFYTYMNYDMSGVDEYYNKMSHFLNKHNIPFKTYEAHNLTKHYLHDVMHIGVLGWLYINKTILEYLKNEN